MGRSWSLIKEQNDARPKPPCKDGVEQGKGKSAHAHCLLPAWRQTNIAGKLVVTYWQEKCSGKD
jgi:hypothetical protein